MKKTLFTVVLILTPVLLVGIAEAVLLAVDYGGDRALVSPTTVAGREMYVLNRNLGARYFAGSPVAIPEPTEEYLPEPGDTTVRKILCIGESTMQGFPYEYGATAPGFLEERLTAMFPQGRVRVINAGLSAVGSFVILDLMPDLAALTPDLIIIYLGHNEFYGVYGAGSAVGASRFPWMTRLTLRLQRLRVFLALRDLIIALRSPSAGSSAAETLMGGMASAREIPLGGEVYTQGRTAYRENLERIMDAAEDAGIPLLFCTLVSNLRDQPPFAPLHTPGLTAGEKRGTDSLLAAGRAQAEAGDSTAAEVLFRRALARDSMHAGAHFATGRLLTGMSRWSGALAHLARAKDLDGLRFRATEEFQQILLDLCAEREVPVARIDSAFAAASQGGIPGYSLILEHLHPTLDGYFLMAKEMCAAMERHGLVFTREEWNAAERVSDGDLLARSAATTFDRTMGGIKVHLLTQRWPFRERSAPPVFHPADDFDELVYRYVRREIPWSEARYAAAAWFAGRNRFDLARREVRAVARVLPFSYYPVFQEAEYWRQEGKSREAIAAYRRCLDLEENPFARMRIAILHMEAGAPAEAIPEIERALALPAGGASKLPASSRAAALYLLGGARARTGDLEGAERSLREALALEPANADARSLLEQVEAARGKGSAR